MASRSDLPSITNFFKVKRKRARLSEKEAALLTPSTKKLAMEESGVKAELFKVIKSEVENRQDKGKSKEESPTPPPPPQENKDDDNSPVDNSPPPPPEESADKSAALEPPKDNPSAQPSASTPTKRTAEEPVAGPSSFSPAAVQAQSPVKFLKMGPLSPAAKNKLNADQVSRVLKKTQKLSDLKTALQGMNNCAQKLEEFRKKAAVANAKIALASPAKGSPTASPFKAPTPSPSAQGMSPAHFYSPKVTSDQKLKSDLDRLSASKTFSSPSKLLQINQKIKKRLFEESEVPPAPLPSASELPAYQRFHALAQKTPAESSSSAVELPLPYHFKVLKELFIAVETVVGIMKNRKEVITFPKVKAGVLELVRRVALKEKHLAQMVTLLPNLYSFALEKVGKETHLKILCPEEMTPSLVCARRKAFNDALLRICQEHHLKFLLGQVPPIVVPPERQITRWHPAFRVDQVPAVVPRENLIPEKPSQEKTGSAREVIAKAQGLLNANPRMQAALKKALDKEEETPGKTEPLGQEKKKGEGASKAKQLKGVSSSLLEKIRNREREKVLQEMTRSPAESARLQRMRRLPQFVKILRNMIVAERKVALPLDTVVERLSHSLHNMSNSEVVAHLRLLATLLPHWARIVRLSSSDAEYFRIDKNVDINALLPEVEELIKKHSAAAK